MLQWSIPRQDEITQVSAYLELREKETSMSNIVSLKRLEKPAIARLAGVFVFVALAIAFFAFPLISLAACGGQTATFNGFTYGLKGSCPQGQIQLISGTPHRFTWVVFTLNGQIVEGEITGKIKVGSSTAMGNTAPEGNNQSNSVKVTINGIQSNPTTPCVKLW
jgi:hypothetical protein